jgi:Protein of unknown function (DUF1588)/Protein of unknown function (DUF1585)
VFSTLASFFIVGPLVACGGQYRADAPNDDAGTPSTASVGAGGAGGALTGTGGMGGAEPPPMSRCGFQSGSSIPPADPPPANQVWALLSFFLYDELRDPPSPLPDRATPEWASGIAMAALDDAATTGKPPAGLTRFLGKWLHVDPTSPASLRWAPVLVPATATLNDVLAPPPSEAHRTGGVLTDPDLLARRPQIWDRGPWMSGALFCLFLPPPPDDVPPPPPPNLTRREAYERSLTGGACAACHRYFDPLGFSLEHFDEHGLYRDVDNGRPVDASGTYMAQAMSYIFNGIDDLAPQLAASCEVARCFAETLLADAFRSDLPGPAAAKPYADAEVARIADTFADRHFSIRALVQAIVTTPSFGRTPAP